ncbi:MAG TPA: PEGA domain-containing protein [Caulobacteraceae bacterium]|jgi:hypothetical protein
MIEKLVRAIAGVSLVAMTSACATVTRGTHESWSVTSEPPGAVTTSNGFSCPQTPCTFKMEHKAEFDVTVSRDGYKPYHGHVVHVVSSGGGLGMAGNVLVGGVVGVVVDVASGAMMELKPNPLVVRLEPEAGAHAESQRVGEPTAVYR